jgi:Domain of unknown function (DUF4926)
MAVATKIPELAVVELTRDIDGHPAGAVGVVVSAHPEDDSYTVEFVDSAGRATDIIFARSDDLRVTQVVRPAGRPQNPSAPRSLKRWLTAFGTLGFTRLDPDCSPIRVPHSTPAPTVSATDTPTVTPSGDPPAMSLRGSGLLRSDVFSAVRTSYQTSSTADRIMGAYASSRPAR